MHSIARLHHHLPSARRLTQTTITKYYPAVSFRPLAPPSCLFTTTTATYEVRDTTAVPATSSVVPIEGGSGNFAAPRPPAKRKPVGGFRGGLLGFLIGLTLAGGAGYYYMLDEYHLASSLLLNSVEELQRSTNKVRDYARKIEAVDMDLKALRADAVTREDLENFRREIKRMNDTLEVDHLEVKAHVWGIEQEIHTITNKVEKLEKHQ